MKEAVWLRYLNTSTYTYAGAYKDYILSLPDDIPSIGMLVCDQITHPSMYFTPYSSYLEDQYYGKFDTYPKHRFRNEDELFITASEAWLGTRNGTLNKKLDIFVPNLLEGIREYLFMDFHALMNNEIFYSYQPAYLRNCSGMLDETELREIDELAGLLQNPDENMEEIEKIWYDKNKFTILTNNTQNIYCDVFEKE